LVKSYEEVFLLETTDHNLSQLTPHHHSWPHTVTVDTYGNWSYGGRCAELGRSVPLDTLGHFWADLPSQSLDWCKQPRKTMHTSIPLLPQ